MTTGRVQAGFDKNPPTATSAAPIQIRSRPHPRVKSHTRARTRRVSGGFRVTHGFLQTSTKTMCHFFYKAIKLLKSVHPFHYLTRHKFIS
jgi:hypothetical protein